MIGSCQAWLVEMYPLLNELEYDGILLKLNRAHLVCGDACRSYFGYGFSKTSVPWNMQLWSDGWARRSMALAMVKAALSKPILCSMHSHLVFVHFETAGNRRSCSSSHHFLWRVTSETLLSHVPSSLDKLLMQPVLRQPPWKSCKSTRSKIETRCLFGTLSPHQVYPS
jgi:hypothetical protein